MWEGAAFSENLFNLLFSGFCCTGNQSIGGSSAYQGRWEAAPGPCSSLACRARLPAGLGQPGVGSGEGGRL